LSVQRRRSSRPRRRSDSGDGQRTREAIEPLHPTETPPDIESFDTWDLGAEVLDTIARMGITKPTPIQALTIGPVLAGKDVIAKAETGTGKTLAFGAPIMSRIDPDRRTVLALILSPTRELTEQVYKVMVELGEPRGVSCVLIVGGENMVPQVKALQAGAQVVVGTPGRILDLMNQGFLSFPWTEFAVLDEADKMLEIGFIDDVKKILEACNEYRQTLLFSATFPTPLLKLARDYTSDPAEIATAKGVATVEGIAQYYIEVDEEQRVRMLQDMIRASSRDDVFLVFCDRRTDVDRLLRRMERERYSVKALHGGYDQAARFRVMSAFRTGEVKALLATDVASRGLDVNHVTHVVNFGVPRDVSDYTHRIGRTGRAGRTGTAVTFVGPRDRYWSSIKRDARDFGIEQIETARDLFRPVRKKRAEGAAEPDERPRRAREPRPADGGLPARRERGESPAAERAPAREERTGEARRERPAPAGRGERREHSRADDERPQRQRAPEAPAAASPKRTTFGRGVEERSQQQQQQEKKRPRKPKPAREERPAPERPRGQGGFGAGLH
jgi:ATP-dependent RNA helicase DeaD